jgi:lipopolysaccharide/colanic/teichoic acid biosynthesis glycosyltransferase
MKIYPFLKRTVDILLTLLLLPIAVPLILIIALILFLELKEFPFFFQRRGLTLDKHCFTIFKLKTIPTNIHTDRLKKASSDILYKPLLSSGISAFASWTRKTGLDELPQIFNILIGQMSFIGPRPLMFSDLETMKKLHLPYYQMRQKIDTKPGLSGMWQIFCNRDEGVKNLIALDAIYNEYKSFSLDLKLMLFTIPVVLTGSNADAIVTKLHFPMKGIFGLSNTTQFRILDNISNKRKKAKSFNYTLELPGNWWTENSSLKNKKDIKILTLNRKVKKTG